MLTKNSMIKTLKKNTSHFIMWLIAISLIAFISVTFIFTAKAEAVDNNEIVKQFKFVGKVTPFMYTDVNSVNVDEKANDLLIKNAKNNDLYFDAKTKKIKDSKLKIKYTINNKEFQHDDLVDAIKNGTLEFKVKLGENTIKAEIQYDSSVTEVKENKFFVKMSSADALFVIGPTKNINYVANQNKWVYSNGLSEGNKLETYYSGENILLTFVYSNKYLAAKKQKSLSEYTNEEYKKEIFVDAENFIPKEDFKYGTNLIMQKVIKCGSDITCKVDSKTVKDDENKKSIDGLATEVVLKVEKAPALFAFSSIEIQEAFINFNHEALSSKGITQEKVDDFFASSEVNITDKNRQNLLLSSMDMYKKDASSNVWYSKVNLSESILLRFKFKDGTDGYGKVYDGEDNTTPILRTARLITTPKLEYAVWEYDKETKDGKEVYKDTYVETNPLSQGIKEIIKAGKYVFDISLKTESDKVVLVDEKGNLLKGDKTEPGEKYYVGEGNNFRIRYIIQPKSIHFSNNDYKFQLEGSNMYNGENVVIVTSPQYVLEDVKNETIYQKKENGEYVNCTDPEINKNGPKEVGQYKLIFKITDSRNYEEETAEYEFEIFPIEFTASIGGVELVKAKKVVVDKKGKVKKDKNGKPIEKVYKYTELSLGLPAGEDFVDGGHVYVSIDGKKFSNKMEALQGIKPGRHTIQVYSVSDNYKKDKNGKPIPVTLKFEAQDFSEVPLLGGFLGSLIPSIAPFKAMVSFLIMAVLLIIAIIMLIVALVKLSKAKKNKVKVKKEKKYDDFYHEEIEKKKAKKVAKKTKSKNKNTDIVLESDEEMDEYNLESQDIEENNIEENNMQNQELNMEE